jgi:hypothetical protein
MATLSYTDLSGEIPPRPWTLPCWPFLAALPLILETKTAMEDTGTIKETSIIATPPPVAPFPRAWATTVSIAVETGTTAMAITLLVVLMTPGDIGTAVDMNPVQ